MPKASPAESSDVEIVPYAPAHQDQVVALILHVQNVEAGIGLTLEEQPDLLAIDVEYAGTGGGFWVAVTSSGQVVGTIGLLVKAGRDGTPWGVMKKFFVRADHRGRAADGGPGVGARLYDTLIAHAREVGLSGVVLDTPAVAARSHAFYTRAGFRQIAREELPLDYHYPDRDSRLFRLDLAILPPNERSKREHS